MNVIRFHDDAQLPAYQTAGAAGFDLHAAQDVTLLPGESEEIRTGIGLDIPDGYFVQIVGRSGLAFRRDVVAAHVGTIDSDYTGEIRVKLFNFGPQPFSIKFGDRIAQALIMRVEQAELSWGTYTKTTKRGADGFGSTGH